MGLLGGMGLLDGLGLLGELVPSPGASSKADAMEDGSGGPCWPFETVCGLGSPAFALGRFSTLFSAAALRRCRAMRIPDFGFSEKIEH